MKPDIDGGKFRYLVGSILLIGGLLFNFAETWYFGWNLKPSCPAEAACDYIAGVIMVSGTLIVMYVNLFQRGDKT